ncbi:pentatricopeptide repeat-containing protein 2, mitochondrial isoform X2 [Siphateles boraxobius]|uniref:pentatricopeptide repeat-containing protein 2, mitochondrial isoform X2 n=1 Tax=Siphateles boraxobius TaxID=180520 RepID=UPI004062E2FC
MALRGLNACARIILTDASRAATGALQSDCFKCQHGAKRHLLSEDVVKLQDFQQKKLAVAHRVSGSKGYYFDTVHQKIEKNVLILKDELKMLLHLCESAEDVIIARNAIYSYHKENRNMPFGEFKFGPLFMRLCYELGLEELAATTLTDPALKGFFPDSTSFNIAIDILFIKQCFESGLEVVGEMKKQGVPFNKDTFTLAFATCYKLNTSKAYDICLTLLEEGQTKGNIIPRHAYCFATALALKQVLILAMKGSMKEAIATLTAAQVSKTPVFVKKTEFSQEVVNELRKKSAGGLWEGRVERVVRRLEEAGQITKQTLDEILCHTPSRKARPLGILEQERKISRRTFKPLQSALLLE